MTLARGAAIGAIGAFAVVLALVLFGGGGGHKYRLVFQTAGQLVKGDEVQVGGHAAGSIDAITLTKDNQAAVDVTVEDQYAPLHEGTTGTVRLTSLSGVANRYIQLDLGPNNAPTIPDNGTINIDHTTSVVDIDQIFNTLDAPTRQGLSRFIQGNAAWYKGKSGLANLATYYFNPALSTTSDVFNQISGDQATLSQAVTATAGAVGAIAARGQDLTDAITYGSQFGSAIAAENESFSRGLAKLPETLQRANTVFNRLRNGDGVHSGAIPALQNLINVSLPNTKGLPELFTALRPAAANAVPVFDKFAGIVYTPGPNNDTTDTFLNAWKPDGKGMQQLANGDYKSAGDPHTSFPESILAAQRGTPVFQFARPYTVDLVGWLREFGGVTSFYDANGHFARISPVFNAYKYNSGTNALDLMNADERTSVYSTMPTGSGTGNYARCPGAASQVPASMVGDWPFLSGGATGCDLSQKVPGP